MTDNIQPKKLYAIYINRRGSGDFILIEAASCREAEQKVKDA